MRIYLDMDGVLTDFNKRFTELFGGRPEQTEDRKEHFYKNWPTFVEGGNFATLEMHPDAPRLLEVVRSLNVPVEILSSSGGKKYHECVTTQKEAWLRDHGIDYKPNIVPGGWLKAEWAKPWDILIDDSAHVVEPYIKAGGTAILHYDIDVTVKKLYELHHEWITGQ